MRPGFWLELNTARNELRMHRNYLQNAPLSARKKKLVEGQVAYAQKELNTLNAELRKQKSKKRMVRECLQLQETGERLRQGALSKIK